MNKKRVLALVLIVVLTVSMSFAALFGKSNNSWKDGTYVGYSDPSDRTYTKAVVTIEKGKIVDVKLEEIINTTGLAKDESYPWQPWHEAMEELPKRFIKANGTNIDTYTGATHSSEMAIQAVERALKRAEGFDGVIDGTYVGHSQVSERNDRANAIIVVKDGKIVDVILNEYRDIYNTGEPKTEDTYPWEPFHEAKVVIAQRILEKGTIPVDTYTGATGSSNMWMEAVKDAMIKAGFKF
ncbi:MAG TPA: FMN-binding protein [Defluviitoga sp.]|nr:FMN-binding protein [Defluviitoga sp.]HOP24365.1 FMN-binding protein [Defluviitoga sp.]HPZ28645.1 FMN-binding protein [Defluviitoga sp.]HQD62564.1 FMN-binding protein [Defluviitoga sp.]